MSPETTMFLWLELRCFSQCCWGRHCSTRRCSCSSYWRAQASTLVSQLATSRRLGAPGTCQHQQPLSWSSKFFKFFSISKSFCFKFECVCNKSYSSKSGLKNHQRFCKVFKAQKEKTNAEAEVSDAGTTSNSDLSFTCPICQACLQSEASLGIHVLKHR